MKKFIITLVILAIIAGLAWVFLYKGVGSFKSLAVSQQNSKNIEKIKSGMKKSEVLKIMGPPNKIEVYYISDRMFEFLLYRTLGFSFLQKDNAENYTPVGIDSSSGVVLSLDRKFYDEILSQRNNK